MRLANRDKYRNVVLFAATVAIVMIGLCIIDLFASYPFRPFAGQTTFDVTYIASSMIVLFMCRHTWKELDLGDTSRHRQRETAKRHYRKRSANKATMHAASVAAHRRKRHGSGSQSIVS